MRPVFGEDCRNGAGARITGARLVNPPPPRSGATFRAARRPAPGRLWRKAGQVHFVTEDAGS